MIYTVIILYVLYVPILYDYVLKTFNSKLLFTDTDSLVYEIKDGNVYDQCFKDRHLFDFSGYPKDSVYYDSLNKKV